MSSKASGLKKRRRTEPLQRRKAAAREHPSGAEESLPSFFTASAAALEGQGTALIQPQPYTHLRLLGLFDEQRLLKVRTELGGLQRTFKETDLFKVFQTGDLANMDAANPTHAAALAETIALRSALYSTKFRKLVQELTGCAELVERTDCSCNVYKRGGHLLCHDDVIGTRCVSYILYLSRPHKKWSPRLGGALEFYPLGEGEVPEAQPSLVLPPEFGSMVLFTVQPGVSFHSVQEVRLTPPTRLNPPSSSPASSSAEPAPFKL